MSSKEKKLDESEINLKDNNLYLMKNKKQYLKDNRIIIIILLINTFILFFSLIIIFINKIKTNDILEIKNQINNLALDNSEKRNNVDKIQIKHYSKTSTKKLKQLLMNEEKMPHLKDLNKKRTFDVNLPLPKEITCIHHFFSDDELMAFMSFLTKDTIFFETGSGCSSVIAKYFAKKTYSIEGCKKWYDKGVKNGLSDGLIFKNLKPDKSKWSYPGKKSTLDDWKNYFQSYKKEYNADVIFIDGRFKTATAMDIFNKINNDTVILIHEYNSRPIYYILEEYYDYKYHWNTLYALMKKKDVKEIPLEIQKKYWDITK